MLQEQVIPIDFGQGIDSKTDPKAVVAGKFLRLENGVFTNFKRIAKRNGYIALSSNIVGGGTLSAPKMDHNYNNELICADSGSLYSYASSSSKWKNVGNYVSTELIRNSVNQDVCASGYADSAVLGNYILYGWSTARTAGVGSTTYCSIVDSSTGTILLGPSFLDADSTGADLTPVRCVTLGGSVLAILYMKGDYTAVQIRTISFSGGVPSISAASSISTGFNPRTGATSVVFAGGAFDVVQTTAGASIIYGTAAGIRIDNINTSGTSSANATVVDGNAMAPYHITQNSNGNIWAYWCDQTDDGAGHLTANSIVYAVYDSSLASVLTKTSIVALATPYFVSNMISVPASTTQHTLYYGIYVATNTAPYYGDQTKYITQTSAGVIGSATWYTNGAIPYSRYFTDNSTNYAVFVSRAYALSAPSVSVMSPITPGSTEFISQSTGFIIKLSATPVVVSRFGAGVCGSRAVFGSVVQFCPSLPAISSNKYIFSVSEEVQGFPSDYFVTSAFIGSAPFSGGLQNNFSYYIDFNSADAYRATNAGELAVLNGGIIQCYDGRATTEWGFHAAPEITDLVKTNTSGGAIANGTYSYIAIWQWIDNQGNLHQSAPSIPASITLGGAEDTITISVSKCFLSQKTGVGVAIYRTKNSGSIYYLVTNPIFLLSATDSSASLVVSYVDELADTSLTGNPQAYTYPASSVLENSTPPPSMVLVAHTNRLWFRNDEDRNEIWYTKSFSEGNGLSPSAFLIDEIDPKFGDIGPLAEMDDKLVIGKASGIFVQSGDGANDTGSGSTLSFPQPVPSDVGMTALKSVILTPKGLMFKSGNGIYMLDRSINVSYIGAEVEAYNSQTITSANLVPGKSQIRFLCSSGLTLVYDYIFNQWSTFTGHTGVSATNWNSTYVYSTGTAIYQETAGTYADNGVAYALLAQTSWLALASIQGFQRVKRLIMLGDFTNGNSALHNLSISAAYDFSTIFQAAITYAFGAASASGVFQYRERLPIQKCDSISLLIQEATTGSALEYIDFTNISFEAGVKKGVNKLGGLKSVG